MSRYARLAFTKNVRGVQEERGSAQAMARLLARDTEEPDRMGPDEADFIQARDGFYLASTGEDGWPYVQFRGGPPGFVHVLDGGTLAWVEVRGNRQYITAGNLRSDDRVSLFFMDYANPTRLKIFGRAETRDPAEFPELHERLSDLRTDGPLEQLMLIRVEGLFWNCPKHITPRYSEPELAEALEPVRERLRMLAEENLELRERLQARD
ncbi:pyridoxamine 5'-phosphate oxidase family protein [Streptomyces bauhiniae]|uniref:Pyridoxamine 5-phosphate oxidase n=1 Tax=Streptomyces bauhiniae TaxID=2340725 RepID=A0A7K3R0D9_9ACTN|nr:pyridoxamine 5'-phosphate oxidase family protein [Streptomyces bauhiniae]NEB95637.1 pyridoxamine 5-phosphate oxidase [Streptomyces bauhiniae]